jgi:phosphoglycolate phosphatase
MRAAIFDLDGTLADSAPDITAALNAALMNAGYGPFTVPAATALIGAGARRLVERAVAARGGDQSVGHFDAVMADFLAFYHAHPCVETILYPGARETLEHLARDGWLLAICTNKPQSIAGQVLDALGIADMFGAVVGGRVGVALKPSAEMVHLALAELSAGAGGSPTRQRSVFIGDSSADVAAAHAAGVPVVVLSHGYSDRPCVELGADSVANSFDGLADLLRNIDGRSAPQAAPPAR